MKLFIQGLGFLSMFISLQAGAVSLERAIKAQVETEISPVELYGRHFSVDHPLAICSALGFARLVTYQYEPCVVGEALVWFNGNKDSGNAVALSGGANCGQKNYDSRISSITCAK